MICPECNIPMTTVPGSEKGAKEKRRYITIEIKKCLHCGIKIEESYEAKYVEEEIRIDL